MKEIDFLERNDQTGLISICPFQLKKNEKMRKSLMTIPKLNSVGIIMPDMLIKKHFPFKRYHYVSKFIGDSGNNFMKEMVNLQ
jgi:hypothetical protein